VPAKWFPCRRLHSTMYDSPWLTNDNWYQLFCSPVWFAIKVSFICKKKFKRKKKLINCAQKQTHKSETRWKIEEKLPPLARSTYSSFECRQKVTRENMYQIGNKIMLEKNLCRMAFQYIHNYEELLHNKFQYLVEIFSTVSCTFFHSLTYLLSDDDELWD
jgi:hypothetical protein